MITEKYPKNFKQKHHTAPERSSIVKGSKASAGSFAHSQFQNVTLYERVHNGESSAWEK